MYCFMQSKWIREIANETDYKHAHTLPQNEEIDTHSIRTFETRMYDV